MKKQPLSKDVLHNQQHPASSTPIFQSQSSATTNHSLQHPSNSSSFFEKILISNTWQQIYDNRFGVVVAAIFIVVAIFLVGIYTTTNSEKISVISFETGKLIEEIASTDFSKENNALASLPSESNLQNPSLDEVLKKHLFSLTSYANESAAALEQASGIIALGSAISQNTENRSKKNQEYFEQGTDTSKRYFNKIHLPEYAEFISYMTALQLMTDPTPKTSDSLKTISPKACDLVELFIDISSKTSSGQEKAQKARSFFKKYPELATSLEQIWSQKIDHFYTFLEKEFGQQHFM